MNRRQILTTAATLWAGAMATRAYATDLAAARPRVVIVGAGILGVSLAYHLAAHSDVIVLDKERTQGLGCTQGAFAMLIADHLEGPPALSALYGHAALDWRRLETELAGQIAVQWGGVLHWARPGAESVALAQSGRIVRGLGGAAQEIDGAAFAALAPNTQPGAIGAALFRPHYGALNPTSAVNALAHAASARGVQFLFGCRVEALQRDERGEVRAVQTNHGLIDGATFVLAAGAGSHALAASIGVSAPINLVSGTLAHTEPMPRVLSRVLNGPGGSIKQDPDGRFVTGLDYRPGADGDDVSQEYGEQLLRTAAGVVPAINGARLDRMTIGYVPIPSDMQPIAGFSAVASNLYLLVTMSGITMAPLLGRLAAREILEGPVEMLTGYRPARFA